MLRLPFLRARLARNTKGSVMIEATLILPIFFLLAFGAIELGRYWWTQNTIERAATKAVRYAVVRGAGWNSNCGGTLTARCRANATQVADEARAHLALLPPGLRPGTVNASCSGGGCVGAAGTTVTVDVTGTFEFILWPGPDVPLSSSATMMVIR